MRKLFQRDKKAPKDAPPPPGAPPPPQDEHWVVLSPSATPPPNGPTPEFSPLPPGAAPLQTQMQTGAGTPQQSPRPGTGTGPGARPGQHMHHASHTTDSHHGHGHGHLARGGGGGGGGQQGLESVSVHSDSPLPPNAKDGGGAGNKLQKKTGFFSRNRDNGPQHQQHQQQQQHEHHPTGQPGELTRMIGYLTGFASDDWTIVLEVCERAAANDANAKEAAKALRREFKYAEPSAQMAAARLWAIMLRYSSDIFIAQTTTKKFLDVVEDVCTSSKTTPVVRERLLEVLAGAAYAHPSPGREGFAGAWRRVKSPGQPDEGIPFDDLDPMFTPPAPKRQQQHTPQPQQQQSPYGTERNPFETRRRHRSDRTERTQQQQQQVPSAEEDMRRLFEECSLASQHAQLLSQAMTYAKPSELAVNSVIREFHQKCMASQDFIVAQIPWATANAERSREKLQEQQAVAAVAAGNLNGPTAAQQQLGNANAQAPVHAETGEEQLLAALLLANQELIEAFRQYDELDRLGMQEAEEREVEARSRVETKIDRTQIQYWSADGSFQLDAPQQGHSGGPSRSPSPSSFNPSSHHNHSSSNLGGGAGRPALPHSNSFSSSQGYGGGGPQIHAQPPTPVDKAMPPPPPAPMGPRRPRSRTPSPTRGAERERDREREAEGRKRASVQSLMASEAADVRERERERDGPPAPSQKALGKRRAVEPELDTHELYRQQHALDETTEESEDESSGRPKRVKAPVHYVYDAAAERSRERLAAQAAAKAAAASKPAPSAKAPNAKSAVAPVPPPASTRPQPKVSPVQTDKGKEAGGGKGSLRGSPLDNREPKRPPAPARSPSQTTPTGKALPRPAVPPVNGNARP